MTLGAMILAGGASSRMGADKAELDWNGRRAVERLADLCAEIGATHVVTSGPDRGLPFVPDAQPFAGPTGGVLACAKVLAGQGCQRLLILAVDAPTVTAADLKPLLEAPEPGACYAGLPLPMVIMAAALPPGAAAGWPLKRLVTEAGLAVLDAPVAAAARLRGANTPNERSALLDKDKL